MTEFTPARLAELKAALEAKTAEVESRIEDRDWFKARAERAERERDEARADAETGAEMHPYARSAE